jgi:hypothetical protein
LRMQSTFIVGCGRKHVAAPSDPIFRCPHASQPRIITNILLTTC